MVFVLWLNAAEIIDWWGELLTGVVNHGILCEGGSFICLQSAYFLSEIIVYVF